MLGKNNKLTNISIVFTKWDFHHLMGLGKLKDLRIAKENRAIVFDNIINEKIKYNNIAKSRYISQIEDRFIPLSSIEQILDNNNLVFRYNKKQNIFSAIEADFLLSTPFDKTDVYIFLFKDEDNAENEYFCRSFFPKSNRDYTIGQARYTLLYKEKVNLSTGEIEIQYDRLKK